MSNTIKPLIAIVSIIILSSGIFVLTKFRPVENPAVTVSSSSVSVQVSSSSKSVLSSSSQVVSSSSLSESVKIVETPKVEESKVETPAVDRGSNPNPVQDIPNVTKLSTDKSIYHQYIRDYLACPTKFYQPLNGGYENDGTGNYKYYCISQYEINNCNNTKNKFRDGAVKGKYICDAYSDEPGGPYLSELDFYSQYFKAEDLNAPSVKGYYTIPKYLIPNNSLPKISFAAIPLESFSQADQQYIAKNFSTK